MTDNFLKSIVAVEFDKDNRCVFLKGMGKAKDFKRSL